MPYRDFDPPTVPVSSLLRSKEGGPTKTVETSITPVIEREPVDRVACRAGDNSCATAHASTLNRATDSQPARAPRSVLQLQKRYGNRYVERVLALAREKTDRAGQSSNLARKSNQTGLPDRLKSGVESLSGISLDNVRVHHNSPQPAQLNALAYTKGNEIHVGPGQEQHLPHEAWHVVQQAQGRVKPTMQMKGGVPVNDDKGLEHEADVMGVRALGRAMKPRSGPQPGRPPLERAAPSTVTARSLPVAARPPAGVAVVQRKIGFEFQSVGDEKWRFQGRNTDAEEWRGINHTKDVLIVEGLAGMSADNGDVEFVTPPLSKHEDVTRAVADLSALVSRFSKNVDTVLVGAENDTAKARSGMNKHKIHSTPTLVGRPQATLGVTLGSIPNLFRELSRLHKGYGLQIEGGDESESTARNRLGDENSLRAIGNATLAYKLTESSDQAEAILKRAKAIANDDRIPLPELDPLGEAQLEGLIAVILKTLWDAFSNSGRETTDAKYAFPFMPRTDFRSMFTSMEPDARMYTAALWTGGLGSPLARAIDGFYPGRMNHPVFHPGGFKFKDAGNRVHTYYGPMAGEWLHSIIVGNTLDPKDLMSPPAPYPRHHTTARPEGIGAMGMDGNLALFELRQLQGADGPLVPEKWGNLMQTFARVVATLTSDDELAPP